MLIEQDFDNISPRSWYIDINRFLYDGHLEIPVWRPSVTFINDTVVFSDQKYTFLDTKVLIVCHTEADILTEMFFYLAVILKIQYGRHPLLFLNDTVVFLDPENIYLDIKISIVCHLKVEILIKIGFYTVAILIFKYGRHKYCEKMARSLFGYNTS